MIHRAFFILLVGLAGFALRSADGARPSIVLENADAQLVIDLRGGSIADFHLKPGGVNPLSWSAPKEGDQSIGPFGHFLCLDRWGPPSDAEGRNGMPYHGEASHVEWRPGNPGRTSAGLFETEMTAELPLAGFAARRTIRLSRAAAAFEIEESVLNRNKLGRMFNMVQHPTIAPPFLDEATIVDCNGTRGFAQGGKMPQPEEPSAAWPIALKADGAKVNLRYLTSDPAPNVVSYVIESDLGWVTAFSPRQRLLIGYLWKSSEYPWVSLWREVRDGKPVARGLEFGSTGLHQPFPVLASKGKIWDRPIFEYIDAGATITKRYICFLASAPEDFAGVESIRLSNGSLALSEQTGGKGRTLTVSLAGLNLDR